VHRRDAFRAEKILQDRLFKHPKIEVIWDSVLDDVTGGDNPLKVSGVRLKNVKTGAVTERKVDGVFIAIGHQPSSELFVGQIQMKPSGYIITGGNSTVTSVPGVFAAGDVTDESIGRQLPRPGKAAWPPSKRRNSWPRTNINVRRRNEHGGTEQYEWTGTS
jgi:thioredoxin reductase (NADPH)